MNTVTVDLQMPEADRLFLYVKQNAVYAAHMCMANARAGRSVTICGAGPSLAEEAHRLPETDDVWACNSAVPYLMDRGVRVTHGFAIDGGADMLGPSEWERTFDVTYLLASSVHPRLTRHLFDAHRRMIWFHNYIGLENPDGWRPPADQPGLTYEMWLYTTLYPTSIQVGHGLNAVPRAVCLALALGYANIQVVGADCAAAPDQPDMPPFDEPAYAAWQANVRMYADGRTAAVFGRAECLLQAVIDGRRWHTRADMVVSVRHLVELQQQFPHITYVGDTLVNALRHKPAAWWDDMPVLHNGTLTGVGLKQAAA